MLLAKNFESIGIGFGLGPQVAGLNLVVDSQHSDLNLRTELGIVSFVDVLLSHGGFVACQGSQGQHRPDDIGGILLGQDVALIFDELEVHRGREIELGGNAPDFIVDVFLCNANLLSLAGLNNQILIEQVIEDFIARSRQAKLGKFVA